MAAAQSVGAVVNESAYRFGEFQLVPMRRQLRRSGQPVLVQPKVLETLTYLIEQRHRVVGTDELIAAIWGRLDVADHVLGQTISRARRVVDDSGEVQHSIVTTYRVGYRWVRDVEICPIEAEQPDDHDSVAPESVQPVLAPAPFSRPHHSWRSSWRSVSGAALVALCFAGFVGWASKENPHPSAPVVAASPTPGGSPPARLRAAVDSNQLDVAHQVLRDLPNEDRLSPEIRYEESMLALKEGRFDGALKGFKTMLADLSEHADPDIIGKALYGAGVAENRRGDVDAAQAHFEKAIDVLQHSSTRDAKLVLGQSWTSLGSLLASCRQLDEAESAYGKARVALDAVGDPAALATLESSTAVLLVHRHRHAEALPRFLHAAELAQRTGDVLVETRARMNLVNDQFALLQSADSLPSVKRLGELREHVGDPILAAYVDLVRVRALAASGRLSEASVLLYTNASRPTPDDQNLAAFRDAVAADLAFAQGALDEGSQRVRKMLTSPWYSPESGLAAFERWRLLKAQQALGDEQGMLSTAAEADAQSRARPKELTVGLYAALARAEAADTQRKPSRARTEFDRALALADTIRVPYDMVHVVDSYVQFLLRHGKAREASTMVNRVAEWAKYDYSAALVQLAVDHVAGSGSWLATLDQTRRLAGERAVPAALSTPPTAEPKKGAELLAVRAP